MIDLFRTCSKLPLCVCIRVWSLQRICMHLRERGKRMQCVVPCFAVLVPLVRSEHIFGSRDVLSYWSCASQACLKWAVENQLLDTTDAAQIDPEATSRSNRISYEWSMTGRNPRTGLSGSRCTMSGCLQHAHVQSSLLPAFRTWFDQ